MKNYWIIKVGSQYMMLDKRVIKPYIKSKETKHNAAVVDQVKRTIVDGHILVDALEEATKTTYKIMLEDYVKASGIGEVVSYSREVNRKLGWFK